MAGKKIPYPNKRRGKEDSHTILHPRYGRYSFGEGITWEKLKICYSHPQYRRLLLGFVFSIVVLLSTIGYVTALSTSHLAKLSILCVTISILVWDVHTLKTIHEVREIYRSPPERKNQTAALPSGNRSPSEVVEGQLVLNARIIHHNRTTMPERIIAISPQQRPVCAEFTRIPQSESEVIVSYVNGILRSGNDSEGIVHSLAITEIHELAHWALSNEENRNLEAVHSQWDDVIEEEVEYVI